MKKLKKSIIVSVMVATVLSMSMLAVPVAPVSASASAGDLIKMDGLSSVYYLAADGKRYVFPNEQTYFSWYSDFSSVVTIAQSELESYPLGANVTIRQGTKLVKITTDPKVYAVESNGSLLHVPDETTATTLYGADWAQRVVDVPDAFFTNYTVSTETVSATAYPEGSLIKTADVADVYYIGADGAARKIASEAAFTGNRFSWDNVITTTLDIPTAGTEIAAADSALIDTSAGAGGTAGAGTGLTVALASDTAASATLPSGAAGVDFTKVNFTAANDGDVTVKNITVTRIGIGASTDFAGVWIYDADGNRLTSARTVSASSNTATFSGVNYAVAAGTTKALLVKATVSGTSGTNGFSINSASDITTDGASVSGSFPVSGNLMSLSSVSAGAVTYTLQAVENATLDVGDTQKEVCDIKIAETSSNEDISLTSIAFTNDGTADANDLENFKLYRGSTLVAEVDSTTSDRVLMALTTPLVIKKGSSKNFSLKADIKGGVADDAIKYDIDDLTDVVAIGNNYGFGVAVIAGGTVQKIEVTAGEFTVEIDGPAAYDVVADADDVVLANMTFTTGANEAVEIKTLYGLITGTSSTTPAAGVLDTAVENVQLVNVDNGDYYDVTADDKTANDDYYFKVTNFTVPAGASNWRIEADLINTIIGAGDKFAFSIYADDVTAAGDPGGSTSAKQGIDAENQAGKTLTDIKPGASIVSNYATVQTASLAIAEVTLSAGDAVVKTKDVELLRFSAEAGSSEAIKMTQVALVGTTTTAVLVDASNYTLLAEDGTVLQSGVSAVDDSPDTV
ncbi:MAG: hypothetical protein U9R14_01695, partial [Patescibacteria group bacterium]|nr:hypothetical protein [Patescibacteria group bacterium]